jgi:signal transduction histidine kinase
LKRKRLRDLEQAYLQQEVMLRQSEKLATLGRLSAGMAHELNNPAAAIQRGAKQMELSFEQHLDAELGLDALNAHAHTLQHLVEIVRTCQENQIELDPLSRSDREYELSNWLERQQVDAAWELAPDLVEMGFRIAELEKLAALHTQQELPIMLRWMATGITILNVVDAVNEAARRITDMVKALKTYTYLDRAPVQNVDVHEGLENTLIMLRSRLGRGVMVHREYAHNLPLIEAYSSELNQVWTNLIDNAVAAMNGQGEITLLTRQDGERIIVEITDNGPGIPEEIQPKIFDPFFTTKAPGEGTGLGLNISYNIIAQKHKGEITVTSQPGKTCFQVKLPLTMDHS